MTHGFRAVLWLMTALALGSCTYMKHVVDQSQRTEQQRADPSLKNLKHLLDAKTQYVYGRILDPEGKFKRAAVAVAGYANAYGTTELVDLMGVASVGTHYGLTLPCTEDTTYRLVVLTDADGNGQFDPHEVIGQRLIEPSQLTRDGGVLRNLDIVLSTRKAAPIPGPVQVPAPPPIERSVFYPAGAIRTLEDPLFDPDIAVLGMYEPAAFTEQAPMMFYALEEDVGYRIPVILVHGLSGTPRQFQPLIDRLDRKRFKPWFFYYPSGTDLAQVAELFYGIFLSGDAVGKNPRIPTVIVAHSMGGVVVREALNRLAEPTHQEIRFISIASPLGGHPSAAAGEKRAPMIVPSWRSLNPDGEFIGRLYRRPLPATVTYQLLYTYRDEGVRTGANSDGVVPLHSQLRAEAQQEATLQRGFDATHVGVLSDPAALDFLMQEIHATQTQFPPDHMRWLLKGGYAVRDESPYGPQLTHLIQTMGQYLWAVGSEQIPALDAEQRHFVEAIKGRTPPTNDVERGWLAFVARHPELAGADPR